MSGLVTMMSDYKSRLSKLERLILNGSYFESILDSHMNVLLLNVLRYSSINAELPRISLTFTCFRHLCQLFSAPL